jgi:DNA-binding SARP family transcriptional activator
MTKTCPACGFVSNSEARFCRMCGALLPRPNEIGDDAVSPSASTVPLSGSRPTTDSLSPHDTGAPNLSPTAAIRRAEFEEFLRSVADPTDAARDDTNADGEHPLVISVRPLDAQLHASDDAPHSLAEAATTSDATTQAAQAADSNASTQLADARAAVATADAPPPAANNAPPQSSNDETTLVRPSAVAVAAKADARSTSPTESSDDDARSTSPAKTNARKAPLSNSTDRATVATERRALRLWAGAAVFAVVAVLVAACIFGAWYVVHRVRASRASATAANAAAPGAPVNGQAKQTADAKLAEADQLLAAGRKDEAVARLREAATLDPANAEPHRRLARLLTAEGARRTAIEELRAVVQLDASDAAGWRDLAAAESAEGLYADAAASYHALFGISSEATRDDHLQLAYADALRLAGRTSEAQSLYKRLATSRVEEIARASRQQLASADATNTNANANKNANGAHVADAATTNATTNTARAVVESSRASAETSHVADANKNSAAPRATPLPASASPKEHYERGLQLWRANRAAALAEFADAAQKGNADASYYLGLNLAEGRDPRAMKRGELIAALTYFQRARRSHYAPDARRYEDNLAKEYDRRRAGGEP